MKNNHNTIDELKTEIIKTKTKIKSIQYDDKCYQQSLINVLNNHLKELIKLEQQMIIYTEVLCDTEEVK